MGKTALAFRIGAYYTERELYVATATGGAVLENYLQVLCQSPLFAGAAEADARAMLQCLGAVVRRYGRGEFVLRSGGPADQMGVVLSG